MVEQADRPLAEGAHLKLQADVADDLLPGEFADITLKRPVVGQDEDAHRINQPEAIAPGEPGLA